MLLPLLSGNRDVTTTGDLTYTAITDTASNLATTPVPTSLLARRAVSDAASISQLASIDGNTDGSLTYTSVADTAEILQTCGNYVNGSVDVNVTNGATISQITRQWIYNWNIDFDISSDETTKAY